MSNNNEQVCDVKASTNILDAKVGLFPVISTVIIALGVLIMYIWHFQGGISANNLHWGNFGAYFSGIMLPWIALLSVYYFTKTIRQTNILIQQQSSLLAHQITQIEHIHKRSQLEDHGQSLKFIDKNIEILLDTRIETTASGQLLREIVYNPRFALFDILRTEKFKEIYLQLQEKCNEYINSTEGLVEYVDSFPANLKFHLRRSKNLAKSLSELYIVVADMHTQKLGEDISKDSANGNNIKFYARKDKKQKDIEESILKIEKEIKLDLHS